MTPFDTIRTELEQFSDLPVYESASSISVLPRNEHGFRVKLSERKRNYVVSFGNWRHGFHKNREGMESAVNLFLFGLSTKCRLKVCYKGGVEYQWDIEVLDGTQWLRGISSGIMIYPVWKTPEIDYFQNPLEFDRDLTFPFLGITNELDRSKILFKLTLGMSLLAHVFVISFDIWALLSSWAIFGPLIILFIGITVLGVHIWFDDRRHLISRNIKPDNTFLYFLFAWISVWGLGAVVTIKITDIGLFFGLTVFLAPFLLCAFLIPILLIYNRSKAKAGQRPHETAQKRQQK